jgi:sodium-dependent phosphate cotransporter
MWKTSRNLFFLLVILYCFFLSIELLSQTFKIFGEGFARHLMEATTNPFVGLFIGILSTSIVQSSSVTTSAVVGLAAGGVLSPALTIPIIMGANIGTTVTNTLVSIVYITRKEEFRRAFSGAVVHDFFNILVVLILFPLELTTGFLYKLSQFFSQLFAGAGGIKISSPLKVIIKPALNAILIVTKQNGILCLIISIAILFFSLKFMVTLIKSLVIGQLQGFVHKYLFRSPLSSLLLGFLLTAIVQSSSATTSLIIPLLGAGLLTVSDIFPYAMGSNIGTTVTAWMASLVTGNPLAITVAVQHILFNTFGVIIFFPIKRIRNIPVKLAQGFGNFASNHRQYCFLYILILFFALPIIVITLWR